MKTDVYWGNHSYHGQLPNYSTVLQLFDSTARDAQIFYEKECVGTEKSGTNVATRSIM